MMKKLPLRILQTTFSVLITLSGLNSHAAEESANREELPRIFQVSLLVFKNNSAQTDESFESAPDQALSSEQNLLLVPFNPFNETQVRLSDESELSLAEEKEKLERSGKYQLEAYLGWQIELSEGEEKTYQLPARFFTEEKQSLTGTMSISLRRYLHAAPQITLTDWSEPEPDMFDQLFSGFASNPSDVVSAQPAGYSDSPAAPAVLLGVPTTEQSETDTSVASQNASNPLSAAGLEPSEYFTINQSRRMRSDELHYFDHPKFGMLLKIMPVEREQAETEDTITPRAGEVVPVPETDAENPSDNEPSGIIRNEASPE